MYSSHSHSTTTSSDSSTTTPTTRDVVSRSNMRASSRAARHKSHRQQQQQQADARKMSVCRPKTRPRIPGHPVAGHVRPTSSVKNILDLHHSDRTHARHRHRPTPHHRFLTPSSGDPKGDSGVLLFVSTLTMTFTTSATSSPPGSGRVHSACWTLGAGHISYRRGHVILVRSLRGEGEISVDPAPHA